MQVHMVFAHMTLQDGYVASFAHLADQLPGAQGHITLQNVVAVFCHPYKMVLDFIDRMWPFLGFFAHGPPPMSDYNITLNLLKLFA
jgi:hypothetical protein